MQNYELLKCRFIIVFIVFITCLSNINIFNLDNFITFIQLAVLLFSFVYMIKTIRLFKLHKSHLNDFYKLCFYLFSGAIAYEIISIFPLIVALFVLKNISIIVMFIKHLIFLAFCLSFSFYFYRKIK